MEQIAQFDYIIAEHIGRIQHDSARMPHYLYSIYQKCQTTHLDSVVVQGQQSINEYTIGITSLRYIQGIYNELFGRLNAGR